MGKLVQPAQKRESGKKKHSHRGISFSHGCTKQQTLTGDNVPTGLTPKASSWTPGTPKQKCQCRIGQGTGFAKPLSLTGRGATAPEGTRCCSSCQLHWDLHCDGFCHTEPNLFLLQIHQWQQNSITYQVEALSFQKFLGQGRNLLRQAETRCSVQSMYALNSKVSLSRICDEKNNNKLNFSNEK